MRILRADKYRVTRRTLADIVGVLRAGGVVSIPTETSYGLAADPMNAAAVQSIFAIKARAPEKSLPLIAASTAQVDRVADLSKRLKKIANAHWPGPLTVVARAKFPNDFGWELPEQSIAIRVSRAKWAREIARAFGSPITATSANISGEPSLYSGSAVRRSFSRAAVQPDLILDVGTLSIRPASTIIAEKDGKLVILRQGAIRILDLTPT